ncbi:MAG TPA: BlaI/MecI/CopY family transcriptional regulator [Egibacteraceae bacterium]|nr:BlaI/MecI/CopY family transcriptional regulator [Egibacteraceae bacterium]
MTEQIQPLGSLEAKVMDASWDCEDSFLSVRNMLQRLDDDLAYTTVMTVMNRLYEKGLLRRRRSGRAWVYRPSMSREAFTAATMSDVLKSAGDRRSALLHFIADLPSEDADALRQLLGKPGGS